ncbi:MAG: amino acid ABC transporter permease [Atopobiaceae bacterium]|jgi:polar amino acid transport system permease protein|nr:amino acid ABC transporter permease [Atopobiaceae bacterium]MCI2173340.1 amino acid ABC transporter permease [Atopobiaceae bacterium]MCI2207335.1 amino acid ABC transporter permease [Atopobiaceae bacterium]
MGGAEILFQGETISRLLSGLMVTIRISLVSVAISIPVGVVVGIAMSSRHLLVRAVLRAILEFVRVMPQLVLLYVVFFGSATAFGLDLSGEAASVIVFSLWGAAELGDLVRGALASIPPIQYDSAYVLGLSRMQTFVHIILPQALARLMPPTMNLVSRMVKTTSLCMLIGVVELIRVGQQIIDFNRFQYPTGALWVYLAIFVMYFLVCWPLSIASRRLERRWAA